MIITTLHYNRPDCTRRCLEALSRCRGIEDCRLIAHTDGGPNRSQEVADLLQQRPFCDTQVCFHPDHLGFDQATFQTLRDGFVDADFVVHIEDDILLAPDALEWFAWARDRYRDDQTVLSVSGLNREDAPPDRHHAASRRPWFAPWSWATWADRWSVLREVIGKVTPGAPGYVGWDTAVLNHRNATGQCEVFPVLGRAQNIGSVSSIHSPDWFTPEWHHANHHVEKWAGDGREVSQGTWEEVAS